LIPWPLALSAKTRQELPGDFSTLLIFSSGQLYRAIFSQATKLPSVIFRGRKHIMKIHYFQRYHEKENMPKRKIRIQAKWIIATFALSA
jgi:hypothetical protein